MESFHFLRPLALVLFVPLLLLVALLLRRRRGPGPWRQACDQALWPHVLIERSVQMTGLPWGVVLLALTGALVILALAGPAWRELPQPVFRDEAALVVVLDVSRSMDAGDVEPSRLERAKHKIRDVLKRRAAGQNALVVYAAHAFAVTPLTDDALTVQSLLESITTDIAPVQGSRPSTALAKARQLIDGGAAGRGAVLLFSDGFDDPDALGAAARLASAGIALHVIAVGTERGAPIPRPDGGFLADKSGRLIVPKLESDALAKLAREGQGSFSRLTVDDADLDRIFAIGTTPPGAYRNVEGRGVDRWREEGPWLLLLALPLAALGFRRGWIGVVLIGVVGVQPMPAAALDWDGLWRTPDQRGHQAFESGDPAKAATQFTDPQWKAAALYRAGRYQEAGELLDGQESVTAHYNRGNALARSGLYRESVAAYDRALELDPKHEDARFNRELVRKQLPEPPSSAESKSPGEGTPEEDSEDSSGGVQQSASRQQGDQSDSGGRGRQLADASDGESGDGGSADSIPPSTEEGKTEAGDDSSKPDGSPGSPSGQAHRSSDRPQRPGEGGDASENESAEQERSMERMLSLVPDDPGELLRRKFLYQYRRAFGDEVVRGDAW